MELGEGTGGSIYAFSTVLLVTRKGFDESGWAAGP